MAIYDGFLFNDELELLQLRFHFLKDVVDYFVVVESRRTLSGKPKPLVFMENRHLFKDLLPKIIHVEAPANDMRAWDYESFQRNCIKKGFETCADDDIVLISDVDEIVHVQEITKHRVIDQPYLIELPTYYYWFNLETNNNFLKNVISPWKDIKDRDIGERFDSYPVQFRNRISCNEINTGWHFSYLFGMDIKKYQNKIKAFSHQEYATDYFLDERRITKCIRLGVDLFERSFMQLSYSSKRLAPILSSVRRLGLEKYLFEPAAGVYFKWDNLSFLFRKVYLRRLLALGHKPFALAKKILKRLSGLKYI